MRNTETGNCYLYSSVMGESFTTSDDTQRTYEKCRECYLHPPSFPPSLSSTTVNLPLAVSRMPLTANLSVTESPGATSGHRRAQAAAFSCSCAADFGGTHCETKLGRGR